MRINPYIQVQQMYNNSQKPGGTKKKDGAGRMGMDGVNISSVGKDIQTAKQALASVPDIRAELVEPIRAAVSNGTYAVSGEEFADKLLKAAGEI